MMIKFMIFRLRKSWPMLMVAISLLAAMVVPVGAQTANLAAGKPVTGSIAIQNAAFITNGDKNTANYAGLESGAQWIQIDLGQVYNLNQVNVWHYFGDGRTYHDVIVKVSNSSTFSSGVTTVFNNDTNNSAGQGAGSDAEYAETSAGKTITFAPVSARYVRLWTNGSTSNQWNHYVEVEVYAASGTTATPTNTSAAPTATRTNTPMLPTATNTSAPSGNLALNKPATASSIEGAGFEAAKAVDGNVSTRWASVEPAPNPEWIYVDLGASYTIARVVLNWEVAYGKSYQIQTSNDAVNWSSPIYSTTTGNGGIDDLTVSGSGRYVRVYMTVRGTSYGYSLWAFEVYGSGGGPTATSTNTPAGPTATKTNTPQPPTATRTPTATSSSVTHPANEMFDDFNYTGPSDGNLTGFGWVPRDETDAGPGPVGADFLSSNISFVTSGSNKIMQLRTTTDGTGAGTLQAEIYTGTRKFLEGTYAARVHFTDAPVVGSYDGDEIVETFFSITPLAFDLDPAYSENDFEYLANGGWGSVGPTMWNTTWETYRPIPWLKDGISTDTAGSLDGWHDLLMTVSGGHVKYYVDGTLYADHSGKYYPETPMSINFNLWIIADNFGGPTTSRTWLQEVDWVYFAQNTVLSQSQVNALLADFRAQSVTRKDNVP